MSSMKENGTTSCSSDRQALNKSLRIRLAAAFRGLDMYGLNEGIFNHLSAIAPSSTSNEDIMLILPQHLHFSEITPSCLLEVSLEGEVLSGEGKPDPVILPTHLEIHRKRPDAMAVMHTHMPYATALTCLKDPRLRMLHQNSARFYNRIVYVDTFKELKDVSKECEFVSNVLREKDILLVRHHGVWIVAESIDVAFDDMYYLERAAMIQVLALSTHQEVKEIEDSVAEEKCKNTLKDTPEYARRHLDTIVRRFNFWQGEP